MALLARDRIFLNDYIQFAWAQRIVAARALREAGVTPDAYVALTLRTIAPDTPKEQLLAGSKNSVAQARVHAMLTARVFGEFFGELEDVGALFRAIGERHSGGILFNNLYYTPAQVRGFFRSVIESRTRQCLRELLHLPQPQELRRRIPDSLYAELRRVYRDGSPILRSAARFYFEFPRSKYAPINSGGVSKHSNRLVHVLLAMKGPEVPSMAQPIALLDTTHNKIKHGFNVLESVRDYSKLPRSPRLMVVRMGRNESDVETLLNNIQNLGRLSRAVIQGILDLDAAGELDPTARRRMRGQGRS